MPTDEELLEAWAAGDQRSGHTLFLRHFDPIRRFFGNKVADHAMEDLVQRTFIECLEALPRFKRSSSFRTFLFGVARNVLREYFRSRIRSQREGELEETKAIDVCDGPVTMIFRGANERRLLKALRRLPFESQVLLELFYFERLSSRELGEVLEINENTVRSRLRHARERLRGEYDAVAGTREALKTTIDNIDEWAAAIQAYFAAQDQEQDQGQDQDPDPDPPSGEE